MADPLRRMLSIAVGSFEDPERELTYAHGLSDELRAALTGLGYECLSPPVGLSSESIGTAVTGAIEACGPGDVLLVHLITHAERSDDTEKVYALGPDQIRHRLARIDDWLTSMQDEAGGPLTLFLLDVCYAGGAARLSWQNRVADGRARGWVIGACAPDSAAFDGRFTQAIVNVVAALGRGELDIDAAVPHAPFVTVARAIGQEVKRLTEESGGFRQQVTGSLLDITAIPPELPFFPNPAYPPSDARQARADVDTAIGPFLDEVDEALDAKHFYQRAAGGPEVTTGCFSGRRKELRELVPFMQGYGTGSLRVVTGSPGVGKSALLGVMVCAAHKKLRMATTDVWKGLEMAPWPLDHLTAVHARRRDLAEVCGSLGRQLAVRAESAESAESLVTGIVGLPHIPVIVIDALDEAESPEEIMNNLLLPLAAAVREDGRPACRLLVGTRRWGFEPLLEQAHVGGGLIDLDQVERKVLRGELEHYISDLFRADPGYEEAGAVRGAFSAEAAKALSVPPNPHEERWGEFLVAGLYSRHVLSGPEITDAADAASLGERVPRTLPEVFALDISAEQKIAGRSLLTAFAYAHGEGMPLALAIRCADAVGGTPPRTTGRAHWDEALEATRFYLRRAKDVDGTTIYRIFHEGLAEHLRDASPEAGARICEAILAPLDSLDGRRWDLAEPYLLRHALDHADVAGAGEDLRDDTEFLIHCDASALATIAKGESGTASLARHLLSRDITGPPDERRRALTMTAIRMGDAAAAERLAVSPAGIPVQWRPLWAIKYADAPTPADGVRLLAELPGHAGAVNAVALTQLEGVTAVVSGGEDQTLRVWDLAAGSQIAQISHTEPIVDLCIGRDGNRPVVLICGANGGMKGGHLLGGLARLSANGRVQAVAALDRDGDFVAVSGGVYGGALTWHFRDDAFESARLNPHHSRVDFLALQRRPDGTVFAVMGERGQKTTVHNVGTHDFRTLLGGIHTAYSVATGVIDGRPVILTGGGPHQKTLLLDEASGDRLGALDGITGTVHAAAIAGLRERVTAITGSDDDTVRFWDLRTHSMFAGRQGFHGGAVRAAAIGKHGDELVAVTGGDSGSLQVWRLGSPSLPALAGTCRIAGMSVALVRGESGETSIIDLRTGRAVASIRGDREIIGVQTAVVAGREMPLLRSADGSHFLWESSSGLIAVDDPTTIARYGSDSMGDVTALRHGEIVWFVRLADGLWLAPHSAQDRLLTGSTKPQKVNDPQEQVRAIAASQVLGRTVLYSATPQSVRIRDVETLTVLDTIDTPGEVHALSADPDGYLLVDIGSEVICFAHSSTTA